MKGSYSKHVIAYIAILGLKEKVSRAGTNPNKVKSIYSQLKISKKWADAIRITSQHHSKIPIKIQMFSDTIVISSPIVTYESFHYVLYYVANFQLFMTLSGVFFRGCITIGDHYQDSNIFFGPAFINACELEKIAVWPRIIIDPDALRDLEIDRAALINSHDCRADADGIVYLDYLTLCFEYYRWRLKHNKTMFHPYPENELVRHLAAIYRALRTKSVKSDLGIQAKYHSLACYHNAVIEEIGDRLTKTLAYARDTRTLLHFMLRSKHKLGLLISGNTKEIRRFYKSLLELYKVDLDKAFAKLQAT